MTPTMKYKRKVIHDMFTAEIESMYTDAKLWSLNDHNAQYDRHTFYHKYLILKGFVVALDSYIDKFDNYIF